MEAFEDCFIKFSKRSVGGCKYGKRASSASGLTTLVDAVKAADLGSFLGGTGPFIVFAPTNAAFAKLDEAVLECLLNADYKDELTTVLQYHVAEGNVASTDLTNNQEITTLQGSNITVTISGNVVKINEATVGPADVSAKRNANDDDTDMDNDGGDNPQRETVQQFLTKLYAVRRISLAETARQRSISIPVLRKRLTQLEEEGRINHCGVVDEVRGEYTIVMSEDMEKLKQYIEEVGSVTLEEVRSNLMGILDLACGVRKDSPVVSGNSSGVLDLVE